MEVEILEKRSCLGAALSCGIPFPLCLLLFLPVVPYSFPVASVVTSTGFENHTGSRENLFDRELNIVLKWLAAAKSSGIWYDLRPFNPICLASREKTPYLRPVIVPSHGLLQIQPSLDLWNTTRKFPASERVALQQLLIYSTLAVAW